MKVWTTKEACGLIPCDGLPIKLLPEEKVRGEFLKKALPDDEALLAKYLERRDREVIILLKESS